MQGVVPNPSEKGEVGNSTVWKRLIIKNIQDSGFPISRKTSDPGPQTKNAPHGCEAFGAENETRTISYNVLVISDLKETEKTSGET